MIITTASLVAAGIAPTQARTFAEPLAAACARFAIHTPARIAAFIGQCAMESAGLAKVIWPRWCLAISGLSPLL